MLRLFLINCTQNTNDLHSTNSFLHSHQIKFAAIRAYNEFGTILWPRNAAPWVVQVIEGLSHMAKAVTPCNQLWPKTLVLSDGRDSITPGNTTSTRPGVGGGNTEVCMRGEHNCSRQIRRALTYGKCLSCR
jgi:hypothetical protein